MNVLIIADGDTRYGASRSLLHMAINLQQKSDLNITVVLNCNSDMVDLLKKHGCVVAIIHYNLCIQPYPEVSWWFPIRFVHQGMKYLYGRIFALKELKKIIKIEDVDLIHSNSSREDFSIMVGMKYHIPIVRHIREFGDKDYRCFSLRKNYINLLNETTSIFIAVSNAVREHWIKKGILENKIVTIYNGVLTRDYIKQKRLPLCYKKSINLVMVGSIVHTKGQDQAIQLMSILKDEDIEFKLDLIGDGTWFILKKLKGQVKTSGLEACVRFLGYRKDVFDLLPNYDVGLICSDSEGFGRVTAEYMMAGLPVLASNTGANSELIREGVDGCLYSYGSVEDMKEKLMRIINNNLGGENTYKYAVNNFSAKVNADNVYSIYKKVLEEY